jgi:CheY-like chemotaxis protein/anti-sigma regulatory factor (Ser/Thr protein kinase)
MIEPSRIPGPFSQPTGASHFHVAHPSRAHNQDPDSRRISHRPLCYTTVYLHNELAERRAAMSKILVVEDVSSTFNFIREVLTAEGYAVEAAADGVEALERLKKEAFDLIVLDIWMPRMDGLQFLASMREFPAPPRVVVVTVDDTPETVLAALRQQASSYITKPFKRGELLEAVRNALAASPLSPPIEVVSARCDWVELLVPCSFSAAETIQDFLDRLKVGLPDDIREAVGAAFRELLLNAIEWGGQLDPSRKVRIACLHTPRMLMYRIADPGPGFPPEALEHSALVNPPNHPTEHLRVRAQKGIRPGGLGIMMVRAMVDELVYNEKHNEVVFVKYLRPG